MKQSRLLLTGLLLVAAVSTVALAADRLVMFEMLSNYA